MRKFFKSLLPLSVVLLALTACENDAPAQDDPGKDNPGQDDPEPEPEPDPEPEAEFTIEIEELTGTNCITSVTPAESEMY